MSDGVQGRYNELAKCYNDRELVQWLSAPTDNVDLSVMRELMLTTRLLGQESKSEIDETNMRRQWDYKRGDYELKLTFHAMAGEGSNIGGFQFKVTHAAEGNRIIMTGYDSRDFDAVSGQERKASQAVSMKNGYPGVASLHQDISRLWQTTEVGSVKYLQARALRQDLQ